MSTERLVSSISRDDLQAVVTLMGGFPCPWFIAGGWSIDLVLGQATRTHEDLEIGMSRQDQGHLHQHLLDWRLYKIVAGDLTIWQPGDWLVSPVHQIVAQQEWAIPPEFEFLLNDVQDGEWQSCRDPRIRRPFHEVYLRTEQDIPVSAPEIQLLYKASQHQPKDEHDFQVVLDHLGSDRRAWLTRALGLYRPGDPWLVDLARST